MQGKCPCNSNSLALSTGKLMRIIVHPVIQPHLCQKNLCLYLDGGQDFTFSFFKIRLLCGEKLFGKHYIFQSGMLRKQIKVLEHQTKMQSFFTDHGFLSGCRDRGIKKCFAIYPDNSVIRMFQKVQAAEKRCLSTSGRSDDGNSLSFFQVKSNVF